MLPLFDDLYDLPLFTLADRELRRTLCETLARLDLPEPGADPAAALRTCARLLGEAGVLTLTVGERGHSPALTGLALAREIIGYHSVIADLAFIMQALGSLPIQMAGSDALRDQWLPRVVSGEAVAAFALSEPNAGSDVEAIVTTAAPRGDVYLLNGRKHLISNAGVADFYSVFARTGEGPKGVSAFFVRADAAGLTSRQTPAMTPHPLGTLEFRDVEVPAANRLGDEGQGLGLALRTLARCRPSVGAAACGFARRALEEALKHVKRRKAFGGVLADQQLVGAKLAECVTELDAARLLVYRATKAADGNPGARFDRAVAEAKWYATEAAQRVIDRCVQLAGGLGVLENCLLSGLYRAIRPLRIYEGASEIQQLVIARELIGFPAQS